MLTELILGAATLIGTTGQFLDAYTTYVGVHVLKVAVEGNPSKITQWLVDRPALNFVVKPGVPFVTGLLGFLLLPRVAASVSEGYDGQIVFSIGLTLLGVWGYFTAKTNAKVNRGWRL